MKYNFHAKKSVSKRMSHVKSKRTPIENIIAYNLWHLGLHYYRNYNILPGKPDIALTKYKIAIFCDGDFWHGYNWNEYKKNHFHKNKKYWIHKITHNMKRDKKETRELQDMGWTVLRFWGHTIKKHPQYVLETIKYYIRGKQYKK